MMSRAVWPVLRDGEHDASSLRDDVLLSYRGRVIRPKTLGQKRYVDAIRSHTITFGLGPAGTGKPIWPWRSPLPRSSVMR